MLKSLAGIVMIPNVPNLQEYKYKDGVYFTFNAISQEASITDKAKVHHYRVNMFIPAKDVKKWQDRIIPGQMFLLTNGSLSSTIPDGKEYPIVEIKVTPNNFAFLKKAVTQTEEKKNE